MLSSHVATELSQDITLSGIALTAETDESLPAADGDQPSDEEAVTPDADTPPAADENTDAPVEDTQTPGEGETPDQDVTVPVLPELPQAYISADEIEGIVSSYMSGSVVQGTAAVMAGNMMQGTLRQNMINRLAGMGDMLMAYIGGSFYVDEEMLASAFQFEMDEEELRRLMDAMSGNRQETSVESNLRGLCYADLEQPSAISIYLIDFAGKEEFLAFLDGYNADMEAAGAAAIVHSMEELYNILRNM